MDMGNGNRQRKIKTQFPDIIICIKQKLLMIGGYNYD